MFFYVAFGQYFSCGYSGYSFYSLAGCFLSCNETDRDMAHTFTMTALLAKCTFNKCTVLASRCKITSQECGFQTRPASILSGQQQSYLKLTIDTLFRRTGPAFLKRRTTKEMKTIHMINPILFDADRGRIAIVHKTPPTAAPRTPSHNTSWPLRYRPLIGVLGLSHST